MLRLHLRPRGAWRTAFALGLLLAALGIGTLTPGAPAQRGDAAGNFQIVLAGIAADSAGALRRPTPATPGDVEVWVRVNITITAMELAATGSGALPVQITASVEARIPSAGQGPAPVIGHFTISPEGTDSAGCDWTRTVTQENFGMTVFDSGDAPQLGGTVLATMVGPEWFYNVKCKGLDVARSPAAGVEGLFYFLRQAMDPYRTGDKVRIPITRQSESSCVAGVKQISGTSLTSSYQVTVYVYAGNVPCAIPPPLPPSQLPPPPLTQPQQAPQE